MLDNILKWCACFLTLAGALTTSLQIEPLNIYLLNVGSVLYLTWAIRIRELSLVVINTGLLVIYVVGLLYRHLI